MTTALFGGDGLRGLLTTMPADQIIHDLALLIWGNGRTVGLDHLLHLGSPDLSGKERLIENIPRGVTNDALGRKGVVSRPRWQIGLVIFKIDLLDWVPRRKLRNRHIRMMD